LERAAAGALLLVLSPLLLSLALILFALSRRAPLIAHRRVGQYGRELWVWKLRTMWDGRAPEHTRLVEYIADDEGPGLKSPDDQRVGHEFAAFCRRHSLDEFPQLLNVMKGEMSLVGPRPVTRRELLELYGPAAVEILRVKPGLTGLWQVSGRNRLSAGERTRLDLELARQRSKSLYFSILRRTIPELVGGKNTW
jgi:lipopolysaccharide/colanic/teichoic acid biosynthesis glycosyltransferase